MTDKNEAPDLKPCPFCKGGETRIEPCGQTWMGQQYSEPQFYRLTHNGKLPEGDGFETCHIQFRARTAHDIVYMWNDTRADLSEAKDERIAELRLDRHKWFGQALDNKHRITELEKLVETLTSDPDYTAAYLAGAADQKARTAELEEKLVKAVSGLKDCQHDIDAYIRQEYPDDHPLQERRRQRDLAANPARATLAELNRDTTAEIKET